MNLKEKIQLAWKNKGQIMEGFYNAYVKASPEVKEEAIRRLEICRSNKCGLYNPKGENNETLKAVFPGKESCGGCGCALYEKCHAMSANCHLKNRKAENYRTMLLTGIIENTEIPEDQLDTIRKSTPDQILFVIGELKKSNVSVPDIGTEPLWEAITTVEQDIEINKIVYKKQFENRK